MKFIKKNFKWIIILVSSILMSCALTVYATTTYLASNVGYTKTGKNVNNVGEALDDLYNTQSGISQTDATAADITKGKKAYTTNGLIVGNLATGSYSTTEQVIGTWVDGKPLYRKVIQTKSPSATSTWTTVHTEPNAEYLTVISAEVELTGTSILNKLMLNWNDVFVAINNNQIKMWVQEDHADRANTNITMVIQYTKTTD